LILSEANYQYELTNKLGLRKFIRAREIYDLIGETRGTFSIFDEITPDEDRLLEIIYKKDSELHIKDLMTLGYTKQFLKEMIKKGFSIYEDSKHYIDFTCTASRCVYCHYYYTSKSKLGKNTLNLENMNIVPFMVMCLRRLNWARIMETVSLSVDKKHKNMKVILEAVWQDSFSAVCYDLLPKNNSINPECSNFIVNDNTYEQVMTGRIDFYIDGNLDWYIEFNINDIKLYEHIERFEDGGSYYDALMKNEIKGALVHFDRRTRDCWKKFLMNTDIFKKWIDINVIKDKEDEKILKEVMDSGIEVKRKKRKKSKKGDDEEVTYPIECRDWLIYFIYHEKKHFSCLYSLPNDEWLRSCRT